MKEVNVHKLTIKIKNYFFLTLYQIVSTSFMNYEVGMKKSLNLDR